MRSYLYELFTEQSGYNYAFWDLSNSLVGIFEIFQTYRRNAICDWFVILRNFIIFIIDKKFSIYMILLHLSEMISQTRIPLPGHFLINAQYVVLSVTHPSRVAKYIVSLVYVKREKQ